MYDKFTIKEKRELLTEVLKEVDKGAKTKERFQDLFLGCEVIRFPLQVNNKYVGRDLIFTFDFMKKPEGMKTSELKVSFASPYYKLIKNEELKEMIERELADFVENWKFREKKESIADYSALIELPEDRVILVRNSYVPSRALKIALGIRKKIPIPVMELKIIHTDKEVRSSELKLKEKVEKFEKSLPIIEELEKTYFEDVIPEDYIFRIGDEVKHKKIKYVGGTREDETIWYGKEMIKKAREKEYTGLEFIEKLLQKVYSSNIYTLKRKTDNLILSLFDELLSKVFV